jgi:uncharacterized protein DUF4189
MRRFRHFAPAVAGLLTLLAASVPGRAWVCSETCSDYYQGTCVQHTTTCSNDSTSSGSGSSDSYGAIAYGRHSAAWGYSYRWGSQEKAEDEAMRQCKGHGDDCESIVWYKNQCGAVAASDADDAFWGLGGSKDKASAAAKQKCDDAGAVNCAVQVAQCSR